MIKKIFLAIAVFCSVCDGHSQNKDFKTSIDSLLTYLKSENAFSGDVTLQKYNQVIYSGNFNKFSNGTERYKVGSVTKVFTAIITYQLIEEGKLSLETTLDKFFPTTL